MYILPQNRIRELVLIEDVVIDRTASTSCAEQESREPAPIATVNVSSTCTKSEKRQKEFRAAESNCRSHPPLKAPIGRRTGAATGTATGTASSSRRPEEKRRGNEGRLEAKTADWIVRWRMRLAIPEAIGADELYIKSVDLAYDAGKSRWSSLIANGVSRPGAG